MPCLTSAQLSLFLDDRLDASKRAAAEEHMSHCANCRHQLVANHDARLVSEEMEPAEVIVVPEELKRKARQASKGDSNRQPAQNQAAHRSGGAGRWWAVAAVLVVAALGFATLDFERNLSPPVVDDPNALRSGSLGQTGGSGHTELQAVSPAEGAVIAEPSLELRWNALPGARRYTLTLLDSLGNILLQTTATDEHSTVDPRQVTPPVEPGSDCFWFVTAQLADGTTVESEVRGFTWSP